MTHSYLQRPDGRIAYEVFGSEGPLVVCVPGMGQLRQTYRMVAPELARRPARVVTMDIRGHGDSDATFSSYDDPALASDILALIKELGEPAFVVGNSMGAAGAVLAAADQPDQVRGLVLLGPAVRDTAAFLDKMLLRALLVRPWGPKAFLAAYPRWLPGVKPRGHVEHVDRIRENLQRPGHWAAFVKTTRTSHAESERRLGDVRGPAVVVMGDTDIDFKNPVAEAHRVAKPMNAEVVIAQEVGHYPQEQVPQTVVDAVNQLIDRVNGA